jgi:hypothetical protein
MIEVSRCDERTCHVGSHCTLNLLNSSDKLLRIAEPTYRSQNDCIEALWWAPWSQRGTED